MKIKITDYKMIDSLAKGNKTYKKVIAQEVKEVLPDAITLSTEVIPNIYKLASIKKGFIHLDNHNLKKGERVKLIFGESQDIVAVKEVTNAGFYVEKSIVDGAVFVYGKEVDDFHAVDYEALSTLNISATQALVKQINDLKAENAALKTDVKGMKADNAAMKSDIEQIKAAIAKKGF